MVAITEMTIKKALIAKPSGTHLLRAATTVDWDAGSALCRFLSMDVSLERPSLDMTYADFTTVKGPAHK